MTGLFRFCDLEEGHVDRRPFVHQGGADDLLAFIAVILTVADRVESLLRALGNLLQEGIRLIPGCFFCPPRFFRQGVHDIAADQLWVEHAE